MRLWLTIVLATSCMQPDVQKAINSCSEGDTVSVPSGQCVWTTGVKVGRNITLQGEPGLSIILSGAAIKDINPGVNLGLTSSRLTGFDFSFVEGADYGVRADGEGWRVDHSQFHNLTTQQNRYAVFSRAPGSPCDPPGGLVDHNLFTNSRVVAHGTLRVSCQHELWARDLKLGADQGAIDVVYIEDNTFNRTISADAADTEYGGRYVFRHNKVLNGTVEAHPIFLAQRGPRAWEIYDNSFVCIIKPGCDAAIQPRGGTGVVFNNTIIGNYVFPIKLDNRRSFDATLGNPPGQCNGKSNWDMNIVAGYPCRDQIGRGRDYELYSGTGKLPFQFLDPAYFWSNTFSRGSNTKGPAEPKVANCSDTVKLGGSCADLHKGDDFIVGERPGYVPFPYPHPLNVQP